MRLIALSKTGAPVEALTDSSDDAQAVLAAYASLYAAVGYQPPWLGYLAVIDGVNVGTCGFKGPPSNNRVELAYFTYPAFERQGVATRMATALVAMARRAAPDVVIAAQTLPRESSSTSILKKLQFEHVATLQHPEDGEVWEWQLPRGVPANLASASSPATLESDAKFSREAETERIMQAALALADAIRRRDGTTLTSLLAPGFQQRTPGGVSNDAAAFVAGVEQIPGEIVFVRLADTQIDWVDQGALMTGIQHARVRIDGEVLDDRRTFVDWFVKDAGQWKVRVAVDLALPAI